MLVQGLVKNRDRARRRAPSRGRRAIEIRARLNGAALELTVTNSAAPSPSEPTEEGGIGLANARERLRLQFGEGATLNLDDSKPGCTTARVLIPSAA